MCIVKIFAKNVKEKRISLGLSQEKLALLSDLDRTYIQSIEKGKRNVSLLVAEKIANAFNIPVEDLIK